jgi:hypothetical protein
MDREHDEETGATPEGDEEWADPGEGRTETPDQPDPDADDGAEGSMPDELEFPRGDD